MLISCVLQCTDGLRLIKRLENYAYRMSEKTAYRSLEKSAYRSLKKLLTVHLQIHLTACTIHTVHSNWICLLLSLILSSIQYHFFLKYLRSD